MMKIMTCKELGGACDLEFKAGTFEEMAAMSREHAMEMLRMGDKDHISAMKAMQEKMGSEEEMSRWFADKRKEFEALPDV